METRVLAAENRQERYDAWGKEEAEGIDNVISAKAEDDEGLECALLLENLQEQIRGLRVLENRSPWKT